MNKRYLLLCLAILALVSAVVAKEYVPTKDEDGFMANTELTKEKKEEILFVNFAYNSAASLAIELFKPENSYKESSI